MTVTLCLEIVMFVALMVMEGIVGLSFKACIDQINDDALSALKDLKEATECALNAVARKANGDEKFAKGS